MHDGTGLQKLHRRRVGPPREKTGRRVLAEAHLADSVARGSGLLWETSLDAELDVVRATDLISCLCVIASVQISSFRGFCFHWMLAQLQAHIICTFAANFLFVWQRLFRKDGGPANSLPHIAGGE